MRRRNGGLHLLPLIGAVGFAGCRGTDEVAKFDVPDPALASGWVQFRHEPGGYAFQAPSTWVVDPQQDARALLSLSGADTNLFLRLVDLEAARKGDLVNFGVARLPFDVGKGSSVKGLDDLGEKALEGLRKNAPDARRERLQLPIGPAEHVWGTSQKVHADGRRESFTSHMVVFATAERPFVLMYGYPTKGEAQYGPILTAIVRTVRLLPPNASGAVTIPASAHAPGSPPPVMATAPVDPYGVREGNVEASVPAEQAKNAPPAEPMPSETPISTAPPVQDEPPPSNPAPTPNPVGDSPPAESTPPPATAPVNEPQGEPGHVAPPPE